MAASVTQQLLTRQLQIPDDFGFVDCDGPVQGLLMTPTETPEDRELAWIGDAVLGLVAREWILERGKGLDGEMHRLVTSNDFLRNFGHPTLVEAELGVLFQKDGLDAVRNRFREVIMPKLREVVGNRLD